MLKLSKFLFGSLRLLIATPETPVFCIAAWVTVKPPIRSTTPPVTPSGPPIPTFCGALMTSRLLADGGRLPEIKYDLLVVCEKFRSNLIDCMFGYTQFQPIQSHMTQIICS